MLLAALLHPPSIDLGRHTAAAQAACAEEVRDARFRVIGAGPVDLDVTSVTKGASKQPAAWPKLAYMGVKYSQEFGNFQDPEFSKSRNFKI